MLTNGENKIKRVIAVSSDGKAMPPCSACGELMTQLITDGYKNIGIMIDCEKNKVVTLGELTHELWI